MAKICGKWRIYLGIGLSVWETAKICGKLRRSAGKWLKYVGKWLNYLTKYLQNVENGLEMGKWPKYLGNGLDAWDTA